MSVQITIHGESAKEALAELFGMAGGISPSVAPATAPAPVAAREPIAVISADKPVSDVYDLSADTAKRERGKPSPGRARRTKEEIAEDEAADAADAATQAQDPAANISTGDERVNPEEAAQDAADEAADEANAPAATASRDDVRAAMTAYNTKFGMGVLTADMTAILAAHWPDGSVTKLSEIPEDPAAFAAVIAALTAKLAA